MSRIPHNLSCLIDSHPLYHPKKINKDIRNRIAYETLIYILNRFNSLEEYISEIDRRYSYEEFYSLIETNNSLHGGLINMTLGWDGTISGRDKWMPLHLLYCIIAVYRLCSYNLSDDSLIISLAEKFYDFLHQVEERYRVQRPKKWKHSSILSDYRPVIKVLLKYQEYFTRLFKDSTVTDEKTMIIKFINKVREGEENEED